MVAAARGWQLLGPGLLLPRPLDLRVHVGGQFSPLVWDGDVWRLATSVMLHADALHLALNAMALAALGRLLEPWLGGVRFLAWFALGGVGGSLASHWTGVVQSDGASGGAFALLGVAVVVGLRWRTYMPPEDQALMGPWLWAFLVLNLVLSFAVPVVDAVGHLGGLIVGLSVSVLPEAPWIRRGEAVGLGVFVGACAFGWLLG
ncbi:MAG: rhomboid family intramembrane serine protease [Myxococcales bacterium]|nr:rhomboid family intramembrane serine protease [Myxococcales bacterium]